MPMVLRHRNSRQGEGRVLLVEAVNYLRLADEWVGALYKVELFIGGFLLGELENFGDFCGLLEETFK